ncbi:MAG: hypothetical protein KJ771_01190 [Nanoarchaeota archaeon]|nr:hypothetical protein [Nanoarchaeota archaeon]
MENPLAIDFNYRSDLLLKHGFAQGLFDNGVLNEEMFNSYFTYEKGEGVKLKEGVDKKKLKIDNEECEIYPYRNQFGTTGFPDPLNKFHLMWEVYDLSLEEPYFWVLNELDHAFAITEKLEDSFAAAEHSAFFGISQQRLGAQQDKVSQFLATTGKMIKELFQMVRELRIIDERMTYYEEAAQQLPKEMRQRGKSAEITLKGIFIDLVQGGGKSAASVYGMARELEFITLPDLFFDAPPFKNTGELERYMKGLEENFNLNVIRVLQRHLRQFMEWKKRTHKEHENRRKFMVQYLYQHFEIIKMYINWVKPYLRHVARMTLKERNMATPDIISAFEGAVMDIELLSRATKDGMNGCLLTTFRYRTRPEMKVVQEGYQRGPVHIGRVEIQFRSYLWTDEQVESYKKLKEDETLMLMGNVSSAVQEAMESLGKELDNYLAEARGKKEQEEVKEKPQKSFSEKFLGDFYTPKEKKTKISRKSKKELLLQKEKGKKAGVALSAHAKFFSFNTYKNFKKSHGLVAW